MWTGGLLALLTQRFVNTEQIKQDQQVKHTKEAFAKQLDAHSNSQEHETSWMQWWLDKFSSHLHQHLRLHTFLSHFFTFWEPNNHCCANIGIIRVNCSNPALHQKKLRSWDIWCEMVTNRALPSGQGWACHCNGGWKTDEQQKRGQIKSLNSFNIQAKDANAKQWTKPKNNIVWSRSGLMWQGVGQRPSEGQGMKHQGSSGKPKASCDGLAWKWQGWTGGGTSQSTCEEPSPWSANQGGCESQSDAGFLALDGVFISFPIGEASGFVQEEEVVVLVWTWALQSSVISLHSWDHSTWPCWMTLLISANRKSSSLHKAFVLAPHIFPMQHPELGVQQNVIMRDSFIRDSFTEDVGFSAHGTSCH